MPLEILTDVLRGGHDAVHEAGAVVVGGHTVVDVELKFGLAVTGRVDPRVMLTNAAARPGDRLVLTKPIGTGIIATAIKRGLLESATANAAEQEMIETMVRLNKDAAAAAIAVGLRCATDVTGFGLLGHASHIARASRVSLHIQAAAVPLLAAARTSLALGARTGGADRNVEYLEPLVDWRNATPEDRALLTDPQTSGGLLVAVPPTRVSEYLSRVRGAVEIGSVEIPGPYAIVVG